MENNYEGIQDVATICLCVSVGTLLSILFYGLYRRYVEYRDLKLKRDIEEIRIRSSARTSYLISIYGRYL